MRTLYIVLLLSILSVSAYALDPARVVVLVNASEAESVELGNYYSEKRGIPVSNIIAIPLVEDEAISWDIYVNYVYEPFIEELINRDLIEGFTSKRKDAVGRGKHLFNQINFDFLVICKGVPLKIWNDKERFGKIKPELELGSQFISNRASVDSELAALSLGLYNIDGYLANPGFQKPNGKNKEGRRPLVVGRLDGHSYRAAKGLINRALEAEQQGISGRVYIDRNGPFPMGDEWLDEATKLFREKGFPTIVNDAGRFNHMDRFDAPLFYFGWYAGGLEGPFVESGFEFPVGAIALHVHSFSAQSIRTPHHHWVGPLVSRGVTGTFGNTSEPYLFFTHHPDLFVKAIMNGLTAGEAALFSIPVLSWNSIYVGDPLYTPPLDLNKDPKSEYGLLRLANSTLADEDDSVVEEVVSEFRKKRSYVSGLWLFNYYLAQEDQAGASEVLDFIRIPSGSIATDWGVIVEVAEAYVEVGKNKKAIRLLKNLGKRVKGRDGRTQFFKRATKLATAIGEFEQAETWKAEADKLLPPSEGK